MSSGHGDPDVTAAAGALPRVEVSLGLWQDRPAEEALATARCADALSFPALWIGEMATYDAFGLATAIGLSTDRIPLVVGPLAVQVRDPAMIAMGAASVASLTGRLEAVALGTSSPTVVERWHGRSRARSARALSESAQAVRTLLEGGKADVDGEVVRTHGYRLRLPAPRCQVVVAAFGPRAIRVAATQGDRMVLNLVSPETAAVLVEQLGVAAAEAGRPRPRVSLWAPAAHQGGPQAVDQLRHAVVGYLAAPGYADMFERAGFADTIAFARSRPHPKELLAAIPDSLVETVAVMGDAEQMAASLRAYRAAGVDDVVAVPASTEVDPCGRGTLEALASLAVG
jgi:probable F420-dependent oxidoreductase